MGNEITLRPVLSQNLIPGDRVQGLQMHDGRIRLWKNDHAVTEPVRSNGGAVSIPFGASAVWVVSRNEKILVVE
jgi:hypothetical protein